MIVRLIVFIAIFAIGWWLYRQILAYKQVTQKPSSKNSPKDASKEDQQEPMVRCVECKTYLPRSHALHDQDANAFCCKEHLQAFNKKV